MLWFLFDSWVLVFAETSSFTVFPRHSDRLFSLQNTPQNYPAPILMQSCISITFKGTEIPVFTGGMTVVIM
jgi:hypothetical protein